jgi:hypothetical protein
MTPPTQDSPAPTKPARRYEPPQAIKLDDAEVGLGGSCMPGSYAGGSCDMGGTANGKCHVGISAGGCGQGTGPNIPQQLNDQHW